MKEIITSDQSNPSSEKNQITSSVRGKIDDIFNELNISIIDDEDGDLLFTKYIKDIISKMKKNRDQMKESYIINAEHTCKGKGRADQAGIKDAYQMLANNPNQKIILMGYLPAGYGDNVSEFVLAHPNVIYLQQPVDEEDLESIRFKNKRDTDNYLELADEVAKQNMSRIKHGLQGVQDPYHPQNESEKMRVENAFEEAKKHFPGLDTLDKMLDFTLHVNVDIPEKMKGKRIEGVYCDADGTLIEYVGIHSGKEGTQQLRQSVVAYLKKQESGGKKIYIWTGGDVEKKSIYLKSLGITRPVVNKYDYAGATAEIVLDDTDQNAFILQSKILPEIYLDTRDRE